MKNLLNRILTKVLYRSRLNLWLGRVFYNNYNGFISNKIGDYVWSRDSRIAQKNGFAMKSTYSSDTLRDKGFLIEHGSVDVDAITNLGKAWSDFADTQKSPENGRLELSSSDQSSDSKLLLPLLDQLITKNIEDTLESYFQSHFRIVNFHLYRNRTPSGFGVRDAYGATANWHTDGSTSESLKLFFLVSNVTSHNGPMEVISKKETKMVFNDRAYQFPDKRGETTKYINECCQATSIEGEVGTLFYALTNDVLHRATIPAEGEYRDLLVFYIISSSKKLPINRQLKEAKYREVIGFERLFLD